MVVKLFIVVYCCRCEGAITSAYEYDQPGIYVTMTVHKISLVYISRCVPCRLDMRWRPFRLIDTHMGVEVTVHAKVCSALGMPANAVTVANTAVEMPIEMIMDVLPGNLTFEWLLTRKDGTSLAKFSGSDHAVLDSVSVLEVSTSRMADMTLGAVRNFIGHASNNAH